MASLHISALFGDAELTQTLLIEGHNVNASFQPLGSPLYVAATHGFPSVAEALISKGADVNYTSAEDGSILFSVVNLLCNNEDTHRCVSGIKPGRAELLAVAKILLESGAHPDAAIPPGVNPLYFSIAKGDVPVVKLLLEHGANIKGLKDSGFTPLHLCLRAGGSIELVKELVKAGADINVINDSGITPLFRAVYDGSEETFNTFLSASPDFNTIDPEKNTLLHAAVLGENHNILSTLLRELDARQEKDTDQPPIGIDTTNREGETPLHVAAKKGCTPLARTLIMHGADIEVKDSVASTPLVQAMVHERDEMVDFLISQGADTAIVHEFRFLKQVRDASNTAIIHMGQGNSNSPGRLRVQGPDGEVWEEYTTKYKL
ncbi:related to ankyrin [Fusarium torulosum]|uniref:Related to ankyrin n=1 Tax=Fusarium torulosum TaxID=33205 RepID=A0AAE8M0G1_9HYPO|nr:related to ankyrin [Fusarium torulosum]